MIFSKKTATVLKIYSLGFQIKPWETVSNLTFCIARAQLLDLGETLIERKQN